jgi:hypothetical protein
MNKNIEKWRSLVSLKELGPTLSEPPHLSWQGHTIINLRGKANFAVMSLSNLIRLEISRSYNLEKGR